VRAPFSGGLKSVIIVTKRVSEKDVLEASIAGRPFEGVGCAATLTARNEEGIEVSSVN